MAIRGSFLLVVFALGGFVGSSFIHVQADTPTSAYLCVAKADGSVRLVNSVGLCRPRTEIIMSFDGKGPKGDKGDPGPRGPRGEPGRDGHLILPDGRCWANEVRYVDCGNGTVTDQVTGLIWLQASDCFPNLSYADANRAVQMLGSGYCGLSDHSVAGQWRLPTHAEWVATTARAKALGCTFPALTNIAGTSCYSIGPNALLNVVSDAYAASTANDEFPQFASVMTLANGDITPFAYEVDPHRVWPVRSLH